jgi:bifunctional non-homologous end joining protein LigD
MAKPLSEYNRKRNFAITSEPSQSTSEGRRSPSALSFVVQKHDARNLHYDFRLELDGALKSWAVPKGPSLDPTQKRLAVHVEDHPLSYGGFEGSIPAGQYGAGDVIVWDRGIWKPHGDPRAAYAAGKLKFTLIGEKLGGDWILVRTRLKGSGDKDQWLLIKENDEQARPINDYDIVQAEPKSVVSNAVVGLPKAKAAKKAASGKTTLPAQLAPQLATLVDHAPSGN